MNPYAFSSFVLSILLFFQSFAFAQAAYQYVPLTDDAARLARCRTSVKERYKKDSISTGGENKKYIVDILRDRYRYIDGLFESKELVADSSVDVYLTNIANEIIQHNAVLKSLTPQFYFSRADWPNAYSTGEGTIVFNIDLFTKLKSESQVAFVICHELAHLFLDHSRKRIDKYVNTVYAADFQEKLKEIQKSTYEKNAELKKLELGFAFNSFRHSRDSESEADSKAIEFMRNTRYDVKEALSALALLDEIDVENIDIESCMPRLFNFDGFPFKRRWIEKEEVFFGGVDPNEKKPMDDSLKTHPECKARIIALTPIIAQISQPEAKLFVQPEADFIEKQTRFQFEVAHYCFQNKKVARSLFATIKLLEKYPGNPYLVARAGACFNEMYLKQKEHSLYTIAELPSPRHDKKYNILLQFINRLSLSEMNSIGYYFLKQHSAKLNGDTSFEKVFNTSQQYFNNLNK